MDRDAAARELVGRSWDEIEADSRAYIDRAEATVAQWRWIRGSGTLWEEPQPLAGDEDPQQVLKEEPPPEKRDGTVRLGYDGDGNIVCARYFDFGGTFVDAAWAGPVLLRFVHEGSGRSWHRVVLRSILRATRDDRGRLDRVDWWLDDGTARSIRYAWGASRLEQAIEEQFEPDGTLRDRMSREYEYDDQGLLRVRWTVEHDRYWPETVGDSGVGWFRRSPKALRAARRLVDAELPGRIRDWAARVAPDEPVYGLGLVHSLDAPALPPALGLGTLAELRGWRERHDGWELRQRVWNPAEFRIFEALPAELTQDERLQDAYALLEQDWLLGENDREPVTTLRRCARRLRELDWAGIVRADGDLAIFVVQDEVGDDLLRQLRATVPSEAVRRIEGRRLRAQRPATPASSPP